MCQAMLYTWLLKYIVINVLHISHFICTGIYAFNLKNWFVLILFVVLFTKILILQPMAESSFKANLLNTSSQLLKIYFSYIIHSTLLQDASHYPLITFLHSTHYIFFLCRNETSLWVGIILFCESLVNFTFDLRQLVVILWKGYKHYSYASLHEWLFLLLVLKRNK